jgi:HlyD family secretion protein
MAQALRDAVRGPRRYRLFLWVLVGAAVVVAGFILWPHQRGTPRMQVLKLYGNIDLRQVDLSFGVDGPIARLLVEEGERVEPGRILAQLELDAFVHAVEGAEAALARAEARLAELVHGPRPQEIERARAAAEAAAASLLDARLIHRRRDRLVDRGAVAAEIADTTHSNLRVAEANWRQAQAELALLQEGTRREQIEQQRAEVETRKADLALLRYRLERATLKAPAAGVIRTRIQEPGAVVGPASPVLNLALTDPLWCRVYVDEPNLGKLRLGMPALITTDSHPGKEFRGWLGYVSPVAEFTPKSVETPELRTSLVYQARVYVCDPDQELRLGMPVTVTLPLDAEAREPFAAGSYPCRTPR